MAPPDDGAAQARLADALRERARRRHALRASRARRARLLGAASAIDAGRVLGAAAARALRPPTFGLRGSAGARRLVALLAARGASLIARYLARPLRALTRAVAARRPRRARRRRCPRSGPARDRQPSTAASTAMAATCASIEQDRAHAARRHLARPAHAARAPAARRRDERRATSRRARRHGRPTSRRWTASSASSSISRATTTTRGRASRRPQRDRRESRRALRARWART